MILFNIFLKFLNTKKSRKIQLSIQVFLCTTTLLIFVGMLLNIYYKYKDIANITNIINVKGNFNIQMNSNNITIDESYTLYSNIVQELKSHNDLFDFSQYAVHSEMNKPTKIYIDNNLNSNIKFPVYKGRTFDESDFDNNPNIVPVLISKQLENTYPINSEFKLSQSMFTNEENYLTGGHNFKVVGVLDDSSKFWIKDTIFLDTVNYFDSIIFPINNKIKESKYTNYLINIKSNSYDYENIKAYIEKDFPQLKLVDSSLKNLFLNKLNEKIIELIFIGLFSIVLVILSLFGFLSVIQSNLLSRKKELGIHYCLGAPPHILLKYIIGEIIVITIIPFVLNYILFYNFKESLSLKYEIILDSRNLLITGVIILTYLLISISFTSINLLKKQPIEVIRD